MTLKVTQGHRKMTRFDRSYMTFYWCSVALTSVSILHRFRDITTCAEYVTALTFIHPLVSLQQLKLQATYAF